MKRIISIALVFAMALAFAACKAKNDNAPETTTAAPTESTSSESAETPEKESKTLVIYFLDRHNKRCCRDDCKNYRRRFIRNYRSRALCRS